MKSVAESMNEMAEIILNLRKENEKLKEQLEIVQKLIIDYALEQQQIPSRVTLIEHIIKANLRIKELDNE